MRDQVPPIITRVVKKLRIFTMRKKAAHYQSMMKSNSLLKEIEMRVVGDASADPTEFFDHYDAFGFWVSKKIQIAPPRVKVLDVGSPKMLCGILSSQHQVTSVVLADCKDVISEVKYVSHDISFPLPFEVNQFDVFTSTVALPLVGLARYGDRLDPNCLPNFVSELDRVMTDKADLFISMCLGPNRLAFNNGWFFDMDTMSRLFPNWIISDFLVDWWSSPKTPPSVDIKDRFSKDADVSKIAPGDYRVVFLHLTRKNK